MPSRSEFPRRPLLGHSCIFPGGQYPSLPILSPSPRAGSLLAHSKENHPFGRQKQPFGGCHLTSSALDSKMLASVRAGLTSLAPFLERRNVLRRILMVSAVAALMAAMMVVMSGPAMASHLDDNDVIILRDLNDDNDCDFNDLFDRDDCDFNDNDC